jgi:hypothetical protein
MQGSCISRLAFLFLFCTTLAACKIKIIVPDGGEVTTESSTYTCAAGNTCSIEISDILFNEIFHAAPSSGYQFSGWKMRDRGLCRGSSSPCALSTKAFGGNNFLMKFLKSDEVFYLEPEFVESEENSERIGFEILEIVSPTEIRAWISPESTYEAFKALELPVGWRKNQPRESVQCGGDAVRFTKSPDATMEGDIVIQNHFGFNWFHAATVTESGIQLGDAGLLEVVRVRKFHEITFNAESCMFLLVSPEGDVYYRVGRAANRLSDEPTLPNLWRIEAYTTQRELVIELFDETLVIRTDNQDSFQGPVEALKGEI